MIRLQNIHKKFGEKVAIHDASCEFEQSKTTVIIGPSGSGKTSLIRCINGLESHDKGEVFYNNQQITSLNQEKINRKIGMVFQNFNLFSHMNVLENLTYAPIKLRMFDKSKAKDKALKLLKTFGIEDKAEIMPSNLSGGQKQRVAIARSLMTDPEVLIFDEPTSALDPESIKDIVSEILDLKHKITIIVVTHHLSFARKIADTIIFMDQGHLLCNQYSQEFFTNPKSVRAKIFMESVGDYM